METEIEIPVSRPIFLRSKNKISSEFLFQVNDRNQNQNQNSNFYIKIKISNKIFFGKIRIKFCPNFDFVKSKKWLS
jgi:hypothetical protein